MDLLQNPFHILTASPRDNSRRIMELADERCLLHDSRECMEARADLTNPRKRLSAEVAWLPGIGPKRAEDLLSFLESSPTDLLAVDNVPSIARTNLLAAGLARLPKNNADEVDDWILEIAFAFEDIDPEELSVIINEERVVSGFPAVLDLSAVESEIQSQRLYYRQIIKNALNNLPSQNLIETITAAVDCATDEGEQQGPILIDDLVDVYEVEAQEFLEKETENIEELVLKLRDAADTDQSDKAISQKAEQLIQVVKNWDKVAQPIQVSAKSRGLNHENSDKIASRIRSVAIYLFNEYGKLEIAQQLTNLLQEVFAEVLEVAERTAEDAEVLEGIADEWEGKTYFNSITGKCTKAIERADENPETADEEAQQIIDSIDVMISGLREKNVSEIHINEVKDIIAITLMRCAISYVNNTEDWGKGISILKRAEDLVDDLKTLDQIRENLSVIEKNSELEKRKKHIFAGLNPIDSAPTLSTRNGIGFALYGHTDQDEETNTYLATYYFVFLGIPVFPLCRYRVKSSVNKYQFIGKAPLRPFDKLHFVGSLILIAFIAFNIFGLEKYFNNSGFAKNTNRSPITSKPNANKHVENINFTMPVKALPLNGILNKSTAEECIAPLTIVTNTSGHHYFVKIEDYYSGYEVMTAFIRSGESVDLDVPLGSYRIKYATGNQWYGLRYLFGPKTQYSAADSKFDFKIDGNQITGYTVQLILQQGGNLRTKHISAKDF